MGRSFFQWLFNKPKTEREVVYPLREDQIKKDKLIKVLSEKVKSYERQLGEYVARDNEEKEKGKKEEKEEIITEELIKQDADLYHKRYGKLFSLNKLFLSLYGVPINSSKSKKGKKFEIADKNDEISQKFGELCISTNGFFVITNSEGNIIRASKTLKGLIYKPESIFNQIKRGRILISADKDGKYIPELDDVEIKVPLFNEENEEYEDSEDLVIKARNLVIQKDEELRDVHERLEIQEFLVKDLKESLRTKTRANLLLQSSANNSNSELTKAMEFVNISGQKLLKMGGQLTNASEQVALGEERIAVLEKIEKGLLGQLEIMGDKPEYVKAKENLIEAFEIIKSNMIIPEQITIQQKEEKKSPIKELPGSR